MDRQRRKDLLADFKERKTERGIIALTCTPTGETWIGIARNLAGQENSLWFTLRQKSHPNRAVQAAFNAHGEAGFRYEVVEVLPDEELTPYLLNAQLKERAAHWRSVRNAAALTG